MLKVYNRDVFKKMIEDVKPKYGQLIYWYTESLTGLFSYHYNYEFIRTDENGEKFVIESVPKKIRDPFYLYKDEIYHPDLRFDDEEIFSINPYRELGKVTSTEPEKLRKYINLFPEKIDEFYLELEVPVDTTEIKAGKYLFSIEGFDVKKNDGHIAFYEFITENRGLHDESRDFRVNRPTTEKKPKKKTEKKSRPKKKSKKTKTTLKKK